MQRNWETFVAQTGSTTCTRLTKKGKGETKKDATIIWTLPSPQRGPLAIGDTSTRTTVKELDVRSLELRLEWDFTLSDESRSLVSWRIGNTIIGNKYKSGVVTIFPAFQGQFDISARDPATLIIYNKTVADGAKFTCSVITNVRIWDDTISVVIYEHTQFIGYSGDKTMIENSSLTLFCNTTGKPTASITWTRVLNDGSNGDVMFVGNPWIIGNIKRTMNGTYCCTASNGFGNTLNHSMQVNVAYPARIENFQREILEASHQNVTLQCPAAGNPPPKYTWSPCRGVCDELKLHLGEVVSDGVYTCSVTNNLGSDAENVTLFIAAKTVNVTLVVTSEDCTEGVTSSVKEKLIKLIDTIFEPSDLNYIAADLKGYSCGSVTVYMALKFNSITKEKDVIAKIRTAVMNGTTEGFTFDVSSITGTRIPPEKATEVLTSPTSTPKGLKLWMIILIVVGVLFLVVLVGNICCWCFSATTCIVAVIRCIRKCICKENQDSNDHTNECQDTKRESERRRGHGASAPKEPLIEYTVVDETKKIKKIPKASEVFSMLNLVT